MPSVMIYGELDIYPLEIEIICGIVGLWFSIISGKQSKLSYVMYQMLYRLHNYEIYTSSWIMYLKNIFDKCGMSNIWMTQSLPAFSGEWLKQTIRQRLRDQFQQKWSAETFENGKCLMYRVIKDTFKMEKYLINIPKKYCIILCKFRTSNHNLPIETGRHTGITRNNRFCKLCHRNEVGDEFNYLFKCIFFKKERTQLLGYQYTTNINVLKLHSLFNSDVKQLIKLSKFVCIIHNSMK